MQQVLHQVYSKIQYNCLSQLKTQQTISNTESNQQPELFQSQFYARTNGLAPRPIHCYLIGANNCSFSNRIFLIRKIK